MDNRLKNSLGGHALRINWKTPKQVGELVEMSKAIDLEWDSKQTMQNFYKPACELMFDFIDEPKDEFWEDWDNFPYGEFEVLQSFFMNPTKAI